LVNKGGTMNSIEIIIITRKGNVLRYDVEEIRKVTRGKKGVTGIRLEQGDEVAGVVVIE